ncbi:hypothetical protein L2E82_39712 [Cichorium intybus]|uniref:Uncharacterized protein n=1 Tax=Cichorium intybus TaxID=13427 RepID=A0ACB9AIC6_CICIN|nr:hypothetical protein L2E82_39712 [Cichorium intybus]
MPCTQYHESGENEIIELSCMLNQKKKHRHKIKLNPQKNLVLCSPAILSKSIDHFCSMDLPFLIQSI